MYDLLGHVAALESQVRSLGAEPVPAPALALASLADGFVASASASSAAPAEFQSASSSAAAAATVSAVQLDAMTVVETAMTLSAAAAAAYVTSEAALPPAREARRPPPIDRAAGQGPVAAEAGGPLALASTTGIGSLHANTPPRSAATTLGGPLGGDSLLGHQLLAMQTALAHLRNTSRTLRESQAEVRRLSRG